MEFLGEIGESLGKLVEIKGLSTVTKDMWGNLGEIGGDWRELGEVSDRQSHIQF